MRIDNNFCYFLKYLCSPEKGCFSCVALKRAVFCKSCYCCLMPVIFAWNSGCWSFSVKYLSDLCLDLSGKNFRICLFHRLRFFYCHSRQFPWCSVFCISFVTLDSFLGDRYIVVTCYYIGWVKQYVSADISLKIANLHIKQHWSFVFFKIKSAEI